MMKPWIWKLPKLFSILEMITETLLKAIQRCKVQGFWNWEKEQRIQETRYVGDIVQTIDQYVANSLKMKETSW